MDRRSTFIVSTLLSVTVCGATAACGQAPSACGAPPARAADTTPFTDIDLGQRLAAGSLRAVNRTIKALEGRTNGLYVSAGEGAGVVWITGTDVGEGTIAADVCGRDVLQESFLGLAFHGQDDTTYEAVYLRPFNFRAGDATRHQHAVQYIAVPKHDWPQLRATFPEEFENPVDASVEPTAWIPLRIVIAATRVQVFVGSVAAAALEVRRLADAPTGLIGLWVGNGSDGGFANLRIARGYVPAAGK